MPSRYIILFLLISCIGCSPKESSTQDSKQEIAKKQEASPTSLYAVAAVKAFPDASVVEGAAAIADYYQNKPLPIDTSWSLFQVDANSEYSYQIEAFRSGEDLYKQVLILTKTEQAKRVLEFVAVANTTLGASADIDARRTEWMERCNQHNAAKLVQELYSNPSIYYNHKPVIRHQDSLIAEYSYMNDPKYSLQLHPLHLESVNENMAYEIGQCTGSYGGKYILIWHRNERGHWKVLLDSNI